MRRVRSLATATATAVAAAAQCRQYSAKLKPGGPSVHGPHTHAGNVTLCPGGLTASAAPEALRRSVTIQLDGVDTDFVNPMPSTIVDKHMASASSFSVFAASIPSVDLRPICETPEPITLFSIATSSTKPDTADSDAAVACDSHLTFALQLPHTHLKSEGAMTVDLIVSDSGSGSSSPSSSGAPSSSRSATANTIRYKVPLPRELILDNDALTFDNNVQRHSIVSPSLVDGMNCAISGLREIVVSGGTAPFAERLKEALKRGSEGSATVGSSSSSTQTTNAPQQRYILVTWQQHEADESLQPTHSPYAILADRPQGVASASSAPSSTGDSDDTTDLVKTHVSCVPVAAFETIARVVADTVSEVPQSNARADRKAETIDSMRERCFDQLSTETFTSTLSPQFYRNMRVLPSHSNVIPSTAMATVKNEKKQSRSQGTTHEEEEARKWQDTVPVSATATLSVGGPSGASSTLPRLVPVDHVYWDHNLMHQHPPSTSLCGCFEDGCTHAVKARDASTSHEALRAHMRRRDAPEVATVRTNSSDAQKFAADARKLILSIENFGFGVMEDPDSLGGFPTLTEDGKSSSATKAMVYAPPKATDADASNSNALIVDYRAAKAEQLITKVFGYVRNCHYGLFSTWSNGDRWKYEDLSDDDVLMTQLDRHNAKNGHKTHNARSSSKDKRLAKKGAAGSKGNLQVLHKSGSDAHADGAYSGIHLDLHTDNTYFVDVPRLQAFGCIFTHTTKTSGGESALVDGPRVALEAARLCTSGAQPTITSRHLTERYTIEQRKRFLTLLCTVPVAGRFEKEEHYYNGLKPIINLTKGCTPNQLIDLAGAIPQSTMGDGKINTEYIDWCRRLQHAMGTARPLVDSVSFNNSDRSPLNPFVSKAFSAPRSTSKDGGNAPIDLVDPAAIREWYRAYEWYHTLLHDPELAIHFTLKPGQMLFFDNHRVLHGRLEFNGPRVMCGSYVGSDEYYSSLKAACQKINQQHQNV